MAKLAFTVALAAVFLFLAVSPAYLQELDHEDSYPGGGLVESLPDLEKVIRLPSGNERVHPIHSNEIDAGNQDKTEKEGTISAEEGVPVTMINFHPINRGFHGRPFLSFRHGHRTNCRHRRQSRPWDPRFQKKEISYGNDMLVAEDKSKFDSEMTLDHQIPQIEEKEQSREDFDHHHRRHGPHREEEEEREEHEHGPHPHPHHGPHGDDEDEREDHEHGPHPHPHPHHGPHGDEEEHEHGPHPHHHRHHHHMEEMDEEEEHKGGFMKVFRKFLNHF